MPYLEGVRVLIPGDRRPPATFDIPLAYFGGLAQAASSNLVKSGKLVAGELFEYLVCAYESQDQPALAVTGAAPRFSIKSVGQVLNISDLEMGGLLANSTACGSHPQDARQIDDGDFPVFIPRTVIDEAVELMLAAGAKEVGGILIGHLRRDLRRGLFLEVTAQIRARYVEEELARLTFHPETFTAVDAALDLRGEGEIYLGWWHSHPASHWCDQCPPEKRQRCAVAGAPSGDFFSAHDSALHRAVFPRAYSIALVLSDGCGNAGTPIWRLFGWRQGMVVPRNFNLLQAAGLSAAAAVPSGGKEDVSS
jgi:proteasome lid subunit RPN8/RPN11